MNCVFWSEAGCAITDNDCPCGYMEAREEHEDEKKYDEALKLFDDEINFKKSLCKFGGGANSGKKYKKDRRGGKKFDQYEEV